MTRKHRSGPEADALYPLLNQFLGGYLHEDWPIFSGTPEKAVEQAIAEYPVPARQQVRRELAALLEGCEDDVRLGRILNDDFGVNLHFKKPGEARAFAEAVERKLLMSIKSHFEGRIEGNTQ
ncbi:MAG TPA: contact-dependent growth inhibition system immunity protein [Allosphingosinicella sp.]|jgi:hypothetical protein